MYQNQALEKERRESSMSSEIHQLKNRVEHLNTEKEQLSKMLRSATSNNKEMASN